MLERLLFVFVVIVFALVGLTLMKRRQIALSTHSSQQLNAIPAKPTIVYFWSHGCLLCRNTQRPILERILAEYGDKELLLTEYNIDESAGIAQKWGVMTLPTTFLLDSAGRIRHVNNGVVVPEKLREQVEAIRVTCQKCD